MNVQNSFIVDSEGTEQEQPKQRSTNRIEESERAYHLSPDEDLREWNVSQLLRMLPINNDDNNRCEHEDSKPPARASLFSKKETTKLQDQHFKLKPLPKFEWRTPSTTLSVGSNQSENDDCEYDEFKYNISREEHENDDDASLPQDLNVALLDTTNHNHQDSCQEEDTVPTFERSLIEVCPGVDLPLRGSLETQHAIARNFTVRVDCINCSLQVNCIRDAQYILCPMCYCVSPLELSFNKSSSSISDNNKNNNNRNTALLDPTGEDNPCHSEGSHSFGVGLGFVDDEY